MKKLFIYIFSIFYFIFSFNCNAEINLEHDNRFLSKEICDAIYKDINFGNNQINEKINVIADLEINRIDTSHKKGTFVAMMYERYSYEEPLFKKLLRDKYMHVDIVKQRVDLEKRGVPPYALCEYNLVSSIREGKFRKLQIYHPFILQSQVGLTITGLPKNKIQVFSGGMISYVYDDFYVEFQKDDYDFRAFPFDTQQFDVMTATRLTKDFVNLELTLEGEKYFEEMQEKKKIRYHYSRF